MDVTVPARRDAMSLGLDLAVWAVERRVPQHTLTALMELLAVHDVPIVPIPSPTAIEPHTEHDMKTNGSNSVAASVDYEPTDAVLMEDVLWLENERTHAAYRGAV